MIQLQSTLVNWNSLNTDIRFDVTDAFGTFNVKYIENAPFHMNCG